MSCSICFITGFHSSLDREDNQPEKPGNKRAFEAQLTHILLKPMTKTELEEKAKEFVGKAVVSDIQVLFTKGFIDTMISLLKDYQAQADPPADFVLSLFKKRLEEKK
ncbi:hypothetical protein ColLi_09218 [Colletotrichum liriopes]|uniref:Uncharacterized protein n=1 Tax=Colletotrichum liriopes TaxID=708192 RepID=A0AA37LUZ9_9PEZI|nr:hypothetical protein ColLi_09218 [Colletotrichum liriopes]